MIPKELRPPSRHDRRRAETREKLFDAAIHLLGERDFDAVTVEMITEAADLGKGTFFNHFPNKEAVVGYFFETQLALLEAALSHVPAAMQAAVVAETTSPGEPGPCWRWMVQVARLVSEREGRNRLLTRNLLALTLTNETVREAHQSVRRRVSTLITEVIRFGQMRRELRSDVEAEILTQYLHGIYFSTLYTWALSEDGSDSLPDYMERHLNLAWRGLREG